LLGNLNRIYGGSATQTPVQPDQRASYRGKYGFILD
jgi:hypothetical protein